MFVFLLVFIYYGIPYIYSKCAKKSLKTKVLKSKVLALTFDDGPSDNFIYEILDLLDKYDSKATFFLLGRNIQGRENTVKNILDRGHEILSHGYDHMNYWKVSPLRAIEDIKKGWNAIDTALGTKRGTYPFRPPYGKLNIIILAYLILKKVPIIYWSDDSGDTWKIKPESDRLAKLINDSPGGVTLNHDINHKINKSETLILESVRLVLEKAKEKNLKIITISELS